jgi:phosphoglucomutase/phosphomannomutase
LPVVAVRDYGKLVTRDSAGRQSPLDAPKGNMLILDLALPGQTVPSGNSVAVRPSGTEPKIKYYLFGVEGIAGSEDLANAKDRVRERIDLLKSGLRAIAY